MSLIKLFYKRLKTNLKGIFILRKSFVSKQIGFEWFENGHRIKKVFLQYNEG